MHTISRAALGKLVEVCSHQLPAAFIYCTPTMPVWSSGLQRMLYSLARTGRRMYLAEWLLTNSRWSILGVLALPLTYTFSCLLAVHVTLGVTLGSLGRACVY